MRAFLRIAFRFLNDLEHFGIISALLVRELYPGLFLKNFMKAYIPLLCVETKDMDGKHGRRVGVLHNMFQCPKAAECELKGKSLSQKSSGFTNLFRHLPNRIARSDQNFPKLQYYLHVTQHRMS